MTGQTSEISHPALFFLFSHISEAAPPTTYQLRFHSLSAQSDQISLGLLHELDSPLLTDLGARASLSGHGFEHFDYKIELKLPWSVFYLNGRISHLIFPLTRTSNSTVLFFSGVELFVGNFGVFGNFGWYELFENISGLSLVPTPWSAEFRDHDFAVSFGLRLIPVEKWVVSFQIGTFDEIEVFRLNNPYFQAAVEHQLGEFILGGHLRYRLLLGFGRLDEWMMGIYMRY